MDPFLVTSATVPRVPIIVSVPHCGTVFPDDLKGDFKNQLTDEPDDTDWFVDKLYDFAPAMGMTMITATYHRWVIDLNRDPSNKPLYNDGRIITGLCPTTTFTGEKLYRDERENVESDEVNHRIEKYFVPYHKAIERLLSETIEQFGQVLLWDCHSIRQLVPSICNNKFPDLILGDNDGNAASKLLIKTASTSLRGATYSFENNFLFKGGYITRHHGRPERNQHALQLEMTKVNYMDDAQKKYSKDRAERMRDHLKQNFEKIIKVLSN